MGLSAVRGNAACSQVLANIARVLTLTGKSLPFYGGADSPLLGRSLPLPTWYGKDGLGDVPDVSPTAASIKMAPSPGKAAVRLAEAACRHPGRLDLVAIGPLTNIALALSLEPRLSDLLRSLTIMGGAVDGGNITSSAEFNFHCDPEAAFIVLKKCKRVKLVTLDVALRSKQPHSAYADYVEGDSAVAKFLSAIGRVSRSEGDWVPFDPLAVAVAIDESLIMSSKEVYATVELQDEQQLGRLLIEDGKQSSQEPNVCLVESVDMPRLLKMLRHSVI